MAQTDERQVNKRRIGEAYETAACEYLQAHGLVVVERNYRVRQGEIDVICKEYPGPVYVFCEVKYRKNRSAGCPEESVTPRKQRQICKVALFYLNHKKIGTDVPCRFDVIAINKDEIRHIKNAFDFCYP
ncbi:MAG: YraN family protein [Lachnospiraceae bacterium]|nr:YraN family protein [Lachnospiraceae bacterium]